MRRLKLALAACLLSTPAQATPAEDLAKLLDEHWTWYLERNPVQASALGWRSEGLGDPSLEAADRNARKAQDFIDRLDRIDRGPLSQADEVNLAILRRTLAEEVEGNRFGQRAITFTTYAGWYSWFAQLPDELPFLEDYHYEDYLTRLEAFPAYNRAAIARTRVGLEGGYAHPCVVLPGFEKRIAAHIVDDPTQSTLYRPFATKPATITKADWTKLRARAAQLIRDAVVPAYRELLTFYTQDYAPKCRATVGISATPGGADYYAYRVRVETTTTMTPEQIHQLGLKEVARIRAEMDRVVAQSGFKGDRAAYIQMLRTDPKYYAKTPAELMAAAALTAKTIDGWMPKLFGKLPRLPYTVKAIPADIAPGTTTAYYEPGQIEAGRAGVYYVNTSKLNERPLYELPALTAHEAVPGHHQQIALQQELDLPNFRRHAVSFTAFTEGWGLYSERLGIEMGLYDTPEKEMGRLSYEMWRACRLVVDTGLHAKGWSRDQAIQYMLDNTALSRANIEAEVDRYITWPAQALGYKIGELKIRELRAYAEKELSPELREYNSRFDLRAFHDAVLENGPVPLDMLGEHIMFDWLSRYRGD